jgi:hypothetical protein
VGTAAAAAAAAVAAAESGKPGANSAATQEAIASADEEKMATVPPAESGAAGAAPTAAADETVREDLIAKAPPPALPEDLNEAFTAIEIVFDPTDERWDITRKALRAAADDARILAIYKDDEMVKVGGGRKMSHKRGQRQRRTSMKRQRRQRGGALDTYTVVFNKPGLDPTVVQENFEKLIEKDPVLEGTVQEILPDPVPVPPPPSREEIEAMSGLSNVREGLEPASEEGEYNNTTPSARRMRNMGKMPENLNVEMKERRFKPKPDGEPFRIEPGDYKGMMSKNKYFIYFDPFIQKKAANVLIRADSKGNFGFYRVTGTDQQIYDGIRSLRGMTEGTIVNQIISNLTTKIKETEARLEATRSDIDIYQATPNTSRSKDNEIQNLSKDEQEILAELDELRQRLEVAKEEKKQLESTAAGTF